MLRNLLTRKALYFAKSIAMEKTRARRPETFGYSYAWETSRGYQKK